MYLQVTGPSEHFREEAAPVMPPYPQAASSLAVRPTDLQRWLDYTYLVATRTWRVHLIRAALSSVCVMPGIMMSAACPA